MKIVRIPTALLAVASAACLVEPAPSTPDGGVSVRVEVTGGIVGVQYAYVVHGDGSLVGLSCVRGCAFAPGDTLLRLTPAQARAFEDAVTRSGIARTGDGTNHGVPCCDHFAYHLTYERDGTRRSVSGSLATFPTSIRDLTRTLEALYRGSPPVVMAQATGLHGFGRDPVDLRGVRVDGATLVLDVSYGGGCAPHDLDAVVWTGWMESHPVQVGVALAHDAHGDTCKALVLRTLRFDLEPLRRAYVTAYGQPPATVLLRVGVGAGPPARTVPFTF